MALLKTLAMWLAVILIPVLLVALFAGFVYLVARAVLRGLGIGPRAGT